MQKFYIHGFRKNRELFLIKYIIKYRTKFVNGKCVGLGEIFGKEKGVQHAFFHLYALRQMHSQRFLLLVFTRFVDDLGISARTDTGA